MAKKSQFGGIQPPLAALVSPPHCQYGKSGGSNPINLKICFHHGLIGPEGGPNRQFLPLPVPAWTLLAAPKPRKGGNLELRSANTANSHQIAPNRTKKNIFHARNIRPLRLCYKMEKSSPGPCGTSGGVVNSRQSRNRGRAKERVKKRRRKI
jgi:hypothetical protein